jgi:hypothetical protein
MTKCRRVIGQMEVFNQLGARIVILTEFPGGEEVSTTETNEGRHQQPQTNETKDPCETLCQDVANISAASPVQ